MYNYFMGRASAVSVGLALCCISDAFADKIKTDYIQVSDPATQPAPEYTQPLENESLDDVLKRHIAKIEQRLDAIESVLHPEGENLVIESPGYVTIKSGEELTLEGEKVTINKTFHKLP